MLENSMSIKGIVVEIIISSKRS